MFVAYSLVFTVGVVLAAPYYLWRLRGKIFEGHGWRERFGYLPACFQQAKMGAIWVHAVSVGETLAAVRLVRELERLYPERRIFMSHVTPAGRAAGESRLPDLAGRFFLPLDWAWSVQRALRRIRPGLLLIVETELWPNLLHCAWRLGSRVILVNARISDRSFRGYRLVRALMRLILENVDWIFAQTARDAERFQLLGARPGRISVAGNLKFDTRPPEANEFSLLLKRSMKEAERAPVLVAASTMAGEEPLLLQAWEELRRLRPRALLILAPRHPARFDAVAQLLANAGRSFVRRTALIPGEERLADRLASAEILLLDTIGELAALLETADVVFVGGSLVPVGGHNPLEPAFWAKPILVGPHMDNFRDITEEFLESGAALEVRDASELARATLELLDDLPRRRQMGLAAKRILEQGCGATERVLERLKEWLELDAATRAMA